MLGSPNLHKLKSLTRSSFFLWNTASTSAELDILCIGYSCPRVPCQFLGCSLQSGLPSPPTLFYLFGKGTVWLESTLIGCAQTAPTVICGSAYMFSIVALVSVEVHISWKTNQERTRVCKMRGIELVLAINGGCLPVYPCERLNETFLPCIHLSGTKLLSWQWFAHVTSSKKP